jgi:hypothetical protein
MAVAEAEIETEPAFVRTTTKVAHWNALVAQADMSKGKGRP